MKKIIFLLSFLAVTGTAFAQKGLHLGLRLQPQISYMNQGEISAMNDQIDYVIPSYGFAGGLAVGYHFTDNVGVELGLLYSAQKQEFKGNIAGLGSEVKSSLGLNYFKLPLLFVANTSPEVGTQFSFGIGPQLGILTGAKQEFNGNEVVAIDGVNYAAKDVYQQIEFGVAMQLGVRFKVTDEIFIDAALRFDYGITDAENKEATLSNGQKFFSDTYAADSNPFTVGGNNRGALNNITGALMIGGTYVLPID